MPTPHDFLRRIGLIVGDDTTDGEVNLQFSWNTYSEAKALLTRMRTIQKELRLLKKEVSATISAIKSDFTTARTEVGKGLGAGLAAGLFGRKMVGRFNSAQRDDLRRSQINAVEPYEGVNRTIEHLLHQIDIAKGQIEFSPEYQQRDPREKPAKPPQLPSPLPTRRFFAFIAEQVKGPYTIEQLQALRDASTITDDTQCCPEGSEVWQSYSHVIAS